MKRGLILLIIIRIFLIPNYCFSSTKQTIEDLSLSTASFVLNGPYFGLKLSYAVAGSIIAGTVNGLSFKKLDDFSESLATEAIGGDWFITPSILKGQRKLEFRGRLEEISPRPHFRIHSIDEKNPSL